MVIKKTKRKLKISVVIPVEKNNPYLKEALEAYSKQTYKNFEVIIVTSVKFTSRYSFARVVTEKALSNDPSSKRNKGVEKSKGEILVFNDDDVYVPPRYLESVHSFFKNPEVLMAGGPMLTPPGDSLYQLGSGAVWESYIGSMGAGVYRSKIMKPRIAYDYPAANLVVRKQSFEEIGGFEKGIWTGEDTILCLQLAGRFATGVYYDPKLYVYHHRRSLFKDHLKQVGRYGQQRGRFALSYPQTSFTLPYMMPALFLVYLVLLPFILTSSLLWLIPVAIYLTLLFIESIGIAFSKNIPVAFLFFLAVPLTHIYYGYRFMLSFANKLVEKIQNNTKL